MKEALASLRDISAFAFVMLNSIFVLIVFLLQLKKDYLHIQWPFNAVNYIIFDASNEEIIIKREYLELEPIGLVFVLFFGVILFIQFIAMLLHRFSTVFFYFILIITELARMTLCSCIDFTNFGHNKFELLL